MNKNQIIRTFGLVIVFIGMAFILFAMVYVPHYNGTVTIERFERIKQGFLFLWAFGTFTCFLGFITLWAGREGN
jgi:hypothetical protein